jgi:predicted NAD/FAD-dependent oxidoreductase
MSKIAIIGSGLAGLSLAHQLQPFAEIQLFDKAQRAGGRLASRSAGQFHFDHGAQFFTVKTQRFAEFIQPLIEQRVIQRWDAQFVEFSANKQIAHRQWNADYPHYVGSPDMQAIAQAFAKPLNIQFDCQITRLQQREGKWTLLSDDQLVAENFDWVICCLPAKQTADLLPNNFENLNTIQQTKMLACNALMLGFDDPPELDWQAALVSDAIISWMSVNSSKPSRPEGFSMVIQANNVWAEQHLHQADETIKQLMLAEIKRISGINVDKASHVDLKRWVYANLPTQTGQSAYLDDQLKLAACGDWCIQGRVEAAFSSADALAQQLIPQLN